MNLNFDFNHIRARKARFARLLSRRYQRTLLRIFAFLLVIVAALMVYVGLRVGYLVGALALADLIIYLWYLGDLGNSQGEFNPNSGTIALHLALDSRVLGRLRAKNPSPYDLWQAVNGLWRQRFFTVRYGIGTAIFEQSLSKDPGHTPIVLAAAAELAKVEHQTSITSATLTTALLFTIPGHDAYLKQLQLEPADLIAGITWQHRIEIVAERLKQRRSFGGIARDWTAGYTPLLSRLGYNISNDIQATGGLLTRDVEIHVKTVDQMINIMKNGTRNNVILVGDVGAGKTTSVLSFAERLLMDNSVPSGLRYSQIFSLDASTILSQVQDRGSLENLVLRIINEAYHAKNIILFFDEAQVFLHEGTGSVDLSNVLLPILQAGKVRIILATTPKQWQELSANNPSLAGVMNYLAVPEPDEFGTMRIMEDQVLLIEYKNHVTFMYQALREAYRLADRYLQDQAFPGKAIKVLEMAVSNAQNGLVTPESVQQSIEATLGVKVQVASQTEKQQLLNLEDQIHNRMINQTRAVKVVSDALRRSRSGVGSPNKPVGTFMFLGPTGVGKTELTKALADVYFGGSDRMIRVDMNEYVQSKDVERLLSASSSETGMSFLSQVRRQPFSVVLFDEIEKAHPDVVNVLLQLLDEGQIKDTSNRSVSFKDAIVIATSNAGADEVRKHIEAGEDLESFEQSFIDQLISSGQFKPEFLNRFDEIVLFRPLNKNELLQVVDLLITEVNKVLDKQKIKVDVTQAAKQWLVDNGYDARLGARPMRRMVQRSVENVVAKRILSGEAQAGAMLHLDVQDISAESVQRENNPTK
ncbi:ATP-dependent Clp protease ATP-binding subunit [Candidatus Saccharibacteria bacterium CPR2]|nr:ATP-dependent Clp protease ATP-binding subunit [Candidatus Saccharibacteria bacterium CPR2]